MTTLGHMHDHPREQALELYVLGSDSLGDDERAGIELHLGSCAGCRDLVERMEEFYAGLRTELDGGGRNLPVPLPDELPLKAGRSIGRRPSAVAAVREVDTALPFRIARWVVRRPVLAGAGAATAFAALAALFLLRPPGEGGRTAEAVSDFNPSAVTMRGSTIIATNRYGQAVGEAPANDVLASTFVNDPEMFGRITRLVDVDGDGKKELLWADRHAGGVRSRQVVRCVSFHPDREAWSHEITTDPSFPVGSVWKAAIYGVQAIEAGEFDGTGAPEAYVLLASNLYAARVLKLDASRGVETGAYHHPGAVFHLVPADVNGDGRTELLLGGTSNAFNDAVVAIVDPARMSGMALHTGDYGIDGMDPAGEMAYLRIPRTIVGLADRKNARNRVKEVGFNVQNRTIRVSVVDDAEVSQPHPDFHIVLRPDLSVELIEPGDGYEVLAGEMYREGTIDRAADKRYLEEFARERILWWNGTGWQNRPTWNRNYVPPASPAAGR